MSTAETVRDGSVREGSVHDGSVREGSVHDVSVRDGAVHDGAVHERTPARRAAAPWHADPYVRALHAGRGPLFLRRADGWMLPLDVERWCADADAADRTVLRRCRGPILDIGCGPGRLVAALALHGHPCLGIDVSQAAVARTVRAGGPALCRSVFEPLPGEGRWGTALLIDGNIGIGGDPRALLARVAQLMAPDGLLIVEAAAADVDERVRVRVDDGRGDVGTAFPWARVGVRALLRHAHAVGWSPVEQWTARDRGFVSLRRTPPLPRSGTER
ncbi:methyltransferase domain-containing protein [Streptomyces rapamycinicus]|uniref:Type 12 methyltransferase n=2 Tax=Streptomyces rapamycinicus TaxID=1226757 RepID=A0A0A0NEE6_STRRN|nr:methyltransferase domain-containing protein [Streptomyces rapamycinicus]AGP54433.1 type 12 methyltransferase [Streptomyces rapamycinicus NRRL 5491]MBB4781938.1 SAM-dependent methyltransferase [Streptomyces rapamycinicus]RLV73420.1 type 12 methyltransferase [Streptomyces rapamycinicus NRRL 5491]UTO62489.1 class I SAM-dependent methyltransferase [Streptomyces rapamycinicus]UTP30445.1 class I SAM-dependent methyltransferase [Streptomyces rapamycinicus NRRL 5491]